MRKEYCYLPFLKGEPKEGFSFLPLGQGVKRKNSVGVAWSDADAS